MLFTQPARLDVSPLFQTFRRQGGKTRIDMVYLTANHDHPFGQWETFNVDNATKFVQNMPTLSIITQKRIVQSSLAINFQCKIASDYNSIPL